MRIFLATAFLLALALTAAGQPPAEPKAPPAPAKAEPKTVPNMATAPQYPTQVGGKNLDQWIKEIDSPDPSHRVQAITTVLLFGPSAKKAIPALVRQLKNTYNDLAPRANAILALKQLVPLDLQNYARDAVDALSMALDSAQGIIRFQAAYALAAIGPAARVTVPKLVRLVVDKTQSYEVRQAAATALGRVAYDENNFPDMRALVALVDGVDDVSKEVRMECLQAIINLGPPPTGASKEYKTLLERRVKKESDPPTRIWVRVALMRLDGAYITDANLTVIAKLMKDDDLDLRIQAARALGYIGPAAKAKVPELIDALHDKEPLMVWQVIWSLSRMEKDAEKALPSLEKIADSHADPAVREVAKQAVDAIKKATGKK
jgi:HEAT repeat protein